MSADKLQILSCSEETNSWTRKGNATWQGKTFYYKFAYIEGDGYEIIAIDPVGEWTEEEIAEFDEWRDSLDSFGGVLDDLTFEIDNK